MRAIIIGGGIGGLAAALSLHAAGIDADVYESTEEVRPLGVGINLQAHAVRELTEYNIEQAGADCQIFFLYPERRDFVVQERREGFVDACAGKGLFYRICDVPGYEYNDILNVLLKIPFDKNKKIVLTSPVLSFTGAVIKMAAERGLVFGKNLFYSDFDNAHSLMTTGVKTVSAIQDYAGMGREIIKALQCFGEQPVKVFVPHRLELA